MMGPIKQVIILGAGASKSEGAPLQNELFEFFFNDRAGFEDLKKSNPKIWNLDDKQELLIKEFFSDFWGIEIYNYKDQTNYIPTFEECLGMLDLANMQEQSFKGYDQEKINKIRNALIFLISARLDIGKLRESDHKELIDRLKCENILHKTVFISLNYDIIIDNILTDLNPEFHIDYGIAIRRQDELQPADPEKSIFLLKPHGSLNWLYCPTCNQIELFPKENIVGNLFLYESNPEDFYNVDCKNCGTIMKSVIIPMTYYKDMSSRYIQQIFLKADEILRQADIIFICGYSFPDADIHIKYLLKRAEKFKGETPEIYVINNHEDKTKTQKQDEEMRFKRFFKNKEKIHYTDKSFQEFVKEGIDIK